jgi:hypothetical protein
LGKTEALAAARAIRYRLHRAEPPLDLKAGTGKQMLHALADQPNGFDQGGAGNGHGRLSLKALTIERRRNSGR